jgi:hypothetical protein
VEASQLRVGLSEDGGVLTLTCMGNAESASFEELEHALASLHTKTVEGCGKGVVIDWRELAFATSSCLKLFVSWLQRVVELDDHQQYRVQFKSNAKHAWQRRSLTALRAFASGVVEVQIEGAT